MKPVTFNDLRNEWNESLQQRTMSLHLPNGDVLRLHKVSEDEEGYGYEFHLLTQGEAPPLYVGAGCFSGIGTGGDNDALDFFKAYAKAFGNAYRGEK